jgi:7SK snRNA methylphosphate capping enzyme
MDPRLRENATHLQLRPHDFPALLQELGFGPPQHLGTSGEGGVLPRAVASRADKRDPGFHRPVDLYVKM